MDEDFDVINPIEEEEDETKLGSSLQEELEGAGCLLPKQCQELLRERIQSFYRSIWRELPGVLDPNDFEEDGGHLYIRTGAGDRVKATSTQNPNKFLKLCTIRRKLPIAKAEQLNLLELRAEAVSFFTKLWARVANTI